MKTLRSGLKVATIPHETGVAASFIIANNGELRYRTAAELLSDIGGFPGANIQAGSVTNQGIIWDGSKWAHTSYLQINDRNTDVGLTAYSTQASSYNWVRLVSKNSAYAGVYDNTNGSNAMTNVGFVVNLNDSKDAIRIDKTSGGGYGFTLGNLTTVAGLLAISSGGALSVDTSAYVTGSGTSGYIPKFTGASSLGNSSIYETGGVVVIGTTTGVKKFNVFDSNDSTSAVTGMLITNGSWTTGARAGILFQSADNYGAAIWSVRTGGTTGKLVLGTNSGAGVAESNITGKVTIDYLGQVGVNITPATILHVLDSSPELRLSTSADSNDGLSIIANSGSFASIQQRYNRGLALQPTGGDAGVGVNPVRIDTNITSLHIQGVWGGGIKFQNSGGNYFAIHSLYDDHLRIKFNASTVMDLSSNASLSLTGTAAGGSVQLSLVNSSSAAGSSQAMQFGQSYFYHANDSGIFTISNQQWPYLTNRIDFTIRASNAAFNTPLQLFSNGNVVMPTANATFGVGGAPSYGNIQATGSGDTWMAVLTTGSNNAAGFRLETGNGTTSGRYAYALFESLETSPQRWDFGMRGTKNFSIYNATGGVTPFSIDTGNNVVASTDLYAGSYLWCAAGQIFYGAGSNIRFVNKAQSGYIYFATRNDTGSEAVWDLTNVGNIMMPLSGSTLTFYNSVSIRELNGGLYTASSLRVDNSISEFIGIQHRGDIKLLNYAGSGWITWGTRAKRGTDMVLDLSVGMITSPTTYTNGISAGRAVYADSSGNFGYNSSSLRYKDSVIEMGSVDWLYGLRPVNFIFKTDSVRKKQYGLIAEEVNDVSPDFVIYDAQGRPDAVEYDRLIAPMIKAIQGLNKRIKELELKVSIN